MCIGQKSKTQKPAKMAANPEDRVIDSAAALAITTPRPRLRRN